MGVAEELADDQPATRPQDPLDLPQGGVRVGDLAEDGDEDHRVDAVLLVWQRGRVALGGDDVGGAALPGAAHRVVEHLLLEIEDLHRARWGNRLGEVERVVAGAGADLQQPLPRLGRQHLAQAGAGDPRVRRLDPEALAVGAGGGVLAPPQRRREGDEPGAERQLAKSHPSPLAKPTRCSPESIRRKATLPRYTESSPSSVSRSCQPPEGSDSRSFFSDFSSRRTGTTCPPSKPISTRCAAGHQWAPAGSTISVSTPPVERG